MNFAKEIMQLPKLIKESSKEMKKVKSICGCAMLTTLNVVAGTFFIPLSPTLRIGFSSIFAGVSGMIYGPCLLYTSFFIFGSFFYHTANLYQRIITQRKNIN